VLFRWCGSDTARPIILEARKLFNATIVGIRSADDKLHVEPDWVQMSLLEKLQDGFRQSRQMHSSGWAIRMASPKRQRDTRSRMILPSDCGTTLRAKTCRTQMHRQKSASLPKPLNRG